MDRVEWAKILQKDGYAIHLQNGSFVHDESSPTKNYILMNFDGHYLKAVHVYPIWRHCFNAGLDVVMYDKSDGKSVEKDFVPLENQDVHVFLKNMQFSGKSKMYCYADLECVPSVSIDKLMSIDVMHLDYMCEKTVLLIQSHKIIQLQRELKLPNYVGTMMYDDSEYELY